MLRARLYGSELLIFIFVIVHGSETIHYKNAKIEPQAAKHNELYVAPRHNISVEWKNISQTEPLLNSYFRHHSGFEDVNDVKWRRKFVKGKWRWLRWNGINWEYQRKYALRHWRNGRGAWRWRRKLIDSHYEMLKWQNGEWNRHVEKPGSNGTLVWLPWKKEKWRRHMENGKIIWQQQLNGQWIRQRLQRARWRWRPVLKDGQTIWLRWDDGQGWRVSETNERWNSSNTWQWRRVIHLGENRWLKWRENAWYLVQWNASGRQSYTLWPTKWLWKPYNDTEGHVVWKIQDLNATSQSFHPIKLYNGNSWRWRQVLDRKQRKLWVFWHQGKWMYRDMDDGKLWKVWKSSESWQWRRQLVNNQWCWFRWLNNKWAIENSLFCNFKDYTPKEKWKRIHRGEEWLWKKYSVKSKNWVEIPSAKDDWRYRKMLIHGRWRWLWYSHGLWHINDKIGGGLESTKHERKPFFSNPQRYVYRAWKPHEAWRWQKVFHKGKYVWLKWGAQNKWWYLKNNVWTVFSSEKWQRTLIDGEWKWHIFVEGKWQKRPLLSNAWRWRSVPTRFLGKVQWERVVWRERYWWYKVKIDRKVIYRKWKPANRWRWRLEYINNAWQWLYWKSNRWMLKIRNGDVVKLVAIKGASPMRRVKIHNEWQWHELIKGEWRRVRLAGGRWRWRRVSSNGRSVWLCWQHGKWRYKDEGGRHRWIIWQGESEWRWHKFWKNNRWQMLYWWHGKWWQINSVGDLVVATKGIRWKIGRVDWKRVFVQLDRGKLDIKSFREKNDDLWRKGNLSSGGQVWLKWRQNMWFTRHLKDQYSIQLDALSSEDAWKWRRTFVNGRFVWLYWKNDRWWEEKIVYKKGNPFNTQWKLHQGYKWQRLKVNNQWKWHYFNGTIWKRRPLTHGAWLWRLYSNISKGVRDEKWLLWREGYWQYRVSNATGHTTWKKWKPFNKWRWRQKFIDNKWTWMRWEKQQWVIKSHNGIQIVPTAKYERILKDKIWVWRRYDEQSKQWHEVKISGGLWRWRKVIDKGKTVWLNWRNYQWTVKNTQNQWKPWKIDDNWRWRQRWSRNRWEIVFWKNDQWWQRSSYSSEWSVAMPTIWKRVRVENQWKWIKLENNRWLIVSSKEISPNWRSSVVEGKIVWFKWFRGKWWQERKMLLNSPESKQQYTIWKRDEAWRWQRVVMNGKWIFLKWGPLNQWWYQTSKQHNAPWILWSTKEWSRRYVNNRWQWFRLEGKIWQPQTPPGETWKKRIVELTSNDGKNHTFSVHFRDGYWRYKIHDYNEVRWLIWKKSDIWRWRLKYLRGYFVWLKWKSDKWIVNDNKMAMLFNNSSQVTSDYRRIKVGLRWRWYKIDKDGKRHWSRLKDGEWRWRQVMWRNHSVWLKWEHSKWWRNLIVGEKSIWFSWQPHENWRWRRVWINDEWKMARFSNSHWWYQISNTSIVNKESWIKLSLEPWKRQLSDGIWIWLRFANGRWQQTNLMEWSSRWRLTQFKSKSLWLRWFHGCWWRRTQTWKPVRNAWKSWKLGKWRHVFNNGSWQWLRFKHRVWNVHHLQGGQWRWRLINFQNKPFWLVWRNGNWWFHTKIESNKFIWKVWKPESSWRWRLEWIDGSRHWLHWKHDRWWVQRQINGRTEWLSRDDGALWKREWSKGHWSWFKWENKNWERKQFQGGSWRWRWTLKDGKKVWLKWQNKQWNQRVNIKGKLQWQVWNKKRAWLWRRVWFTQKWRWLVWRQGQWYLLNQNHLKSSFSAWRGQAWRIVLSGGKRNWQRRDRDGKWSTIKSLNENWRWRVAYTKTGRNQVEVRWHRGKWLAQSWRPGLERWRPWQSGAWRRQLVQNQWTWQRLIGNKWITVQLLNGRSWRRWRTANRGKNVVWLQFWRGQWRERFLKDKLWQWRPWRSRFIWSYSWVNQGWRLLRWRHNNWEWFNHDISKWIVWQAGQWRRVCHDGSKCMWMQYLNGQWIEQRLSWRWYRTHDLVWLHWHNQQWWSQQKSSSGKVVWVPALNREGWRWQFRFIFGRWHWLKWHLGQWRYRVQVKKDANRWKWLVWKRGLWRRTFSEGKWIWQELQGKQWRQVHLRGGVWRWRRDMVNGRLRWLHWKHDQWWIRVVNGNRSTWEVHGSEHWRWFRNWMKSRWIWMHWNGGHWLYKSRSRGHWIWKTWQRSSQERWKIKSPANRWTGVTNSTINGIIRVYNKRLYYFSKIKFSWFRANEFCQNLWNGDGQLVHINDMNENLFLQRVVQSAWIGNHFLDWLNNSTKLSNFTNWSSHHSNTSNCSIISNNGTWNFVSCFGMYRYICSKKHTLFEPKPSYCPREFTLRETIKPENCTTLRNGQSTVECKSNTNCSSTEQCCFNGCFRECMGPGRLVYHVCLDFEGNRFLPGDDFQLGCHMCSCNVYGQATNCRQLLPCSPKSDPERMHSDLLKKLPEENNLLTGKGYVEKDKEKSMKQMIFKGLDHTKTTQQMV